MNKYLLITIGVLLILVMWGYDKIQDQRAEIRKQDRNISALISEQEEYITKLGDYAVKKKALEVSQMELKEINGRLRDDLKALNLRLKDALSASQVTTKTEIHETVRTDTIAGVLHAEFTDPWNRIVTDLSSDSTRLSYIGTDTITGVISITKKRFLFFRYGIKSVDYDISNKNKCTKTTIDIAVKFK
nr:MAG: hypothetical protein [Bacteriophage sp.]